MCGGCASTPARTRSRAAGTTSWRDPAWAEGGGAGRGGPSPAAESGRRAAHPRTSATLDLLLDRYPRRSTSAAPRRGWTSVTSRSMCGRSSGSSRPARWIPTCWTRCTSRCVAAESTARGGRRRSPDPAGTRLRRAMWAAPMPPTVRVDDPARSISCSAVRTRKAVRRRWVATDALPLVKAPPARAPPSLRSVTGSAGVVPESSLPQDAASAPLAAEAEFRAVGVR